MAIERLKGNEIRKALVSGRACKMEDGGGLRLVIKGADRAKWVFRYQRAGVRREMGLGSVDAVPLAIARELAAQHRITLARGVDPLDARHQHSRKVAAELASAVTFRQATAAFLAHRDKTSTNKRLNSLWRSTLEAYALPVLGSLSVATIERQHVLKVVEPLWHSKPETAARVRARVESVLDAAIARGQRALDNPARWEVLKPVLGKRGAPVKHHASLDWKSLPAFMATLREDESLAARALEFTILCACRTTESLQAEWDEIDDDVWTIPASRTKMRKLHKVPLSPEARALLERLDNIRRPPFVFFGTREDRPLSAMVMIKLLRRMGRADITTHGFRSSFRSWCADNGHDRELAEAALSHFAGGTEGIYQRADMLERRRVLMTAWAAYCTRPPIAAGNVTPIRRA